MPPQGRVVQSKINSSIIMVIMVMGLEMGLVMVVINQMALSNNNIVHKMFKIHLNCPREAT